MKYIVAIFLLLMSSIAYAIECTDTQSEISIAPPKERSDGTPFPSTENWGYVIYYGEVKGEYTNSLDVPYTGPITVTCIEKSSVPLYMVATTKDKDGRESVYTPNVEIIDALPPISKSDPNPPIFITKAPFEQGDAPQHIVKFVASDYHLNTPNGIYEWLQDGTTMIATPNSDKSFDIDYIENSPRLDYLVRFNQIGTHYIWVSGKSIDPVDTGRNNSLHVGLNGKSVPTSERIDFAEPLDFSWTNKNMTEEVVSFEITSTGLQTISIWMREDGFIFDKLMITTDPTIICPDGSVCE